VAFLVPYVFEYMQDRAKAILNHINPNVRAIGQGEGRHRKYKRLKLGGSKLTSVPVTNCSFGVAA
jgi:hypothetical protein